MRTSRLWPAALCLGAFAWAAPAHAEGLLPNCHLPCIPPFKVQFSVRFNISSTAHPHPTAPWWAYFPEGSENPAPPYTTVYPHWPTSFPPANSTRETAPAPNVTQRPGSTPLYHPASYSRGSQNVGAVNFGAPSSGTPTFGTHTYGAQAYGVPSYWYSR